MISYDHIICICLGQWQIRSVTVRCFFRGPGCLSGAGGLRRSPAEVAEALGGKYRGKAEVSGDSSNSWRFPKNAWHPKIVHLYRWMFHSKPSSYWGSKMLGNHSWSPKVDRQRLRTDMNRSDVYWIICMARPKEKIWNIYASGLHWFPVQLFLHRLDSKLLETSLTICSLCKNWQS